MANRNGLSQGCKIRVKGRPGSEVIESCARSSSSSSRSLSPSKLTWSPHLKHFHCGASVGSRASAFDVGHRHSVKSRVMGVIKAMVTQCRSLLPWVWQPGRGQRHRPRISSSIGDHHRGVINIGCSLWHCRRWLWSSSSLSVVIVVLNLGRGLWRIQHRPWSLLTVVIAVSISAVIVIVVGHGLWHFRCWSL